MTPSTPLPSTLEVFDPPMCCSTGVCGPEVDPELVAFSETLNDLTRQGVQVTRHNLAQEPLAFTQHPEVRALLQTSKAEDILPLIFVDGSLAFQGLYPDREKLLAAVGRPPLVSLTPKTSSCCGGTSCC